MSKISCLYQEDGCRLNDVQGVHGKITKSGAYCSAGMRAGGVLSSQAACSQQNAPTKLTGPGRRPVALPAPSQTTGRHEFTAGNGAEASVYVIQRNRSCQREQGPRAAVEAPDQFSLTSVVPSSRALATAGASASAFSSEVA